MRHIPAPHGQCGHAVLAMVSGHTLASVRGPWRVRSLKAMRWICDGLGLITGALHYRPESLACLPVVGKWVVLTHSKRRGAGWIVVEDNWVHDPGWPRRVKLLEYAPKFARKNRVVGFFQVLGAV